MTNIGDPALKEEIDKALKEMLLLPTLDQKIDRGRELYRKYGFMLSARPLWVEFFTKHQAEINARKK